MNLCAENCEYFSKQPTDWHGIACLKQKQFCMQNFVLTVSGMDLLVPKDTLYANAKAILLLQLSHTLELLLLRTLANAR